MGESPPGMSIDRINNDGDYTPDNCRWSTAKQQNRNKRTLHIVTFNNENLCVAEWAERLHCKGATLRNRLSKGWSVEETLTIPIGHRRQREIIH
jgi:hypothetical protein